MEYELSRYLFQRAVAGIYLLGFLNIVNQFPALCGSRGLLPVGNYLPKITWRRIPSLFYWSHSDLTLRVAGYTGVFLSLVALTGLSDSRGYLLSLVTWFLLWILYLSFVNVGQTFYGFGWESMMLETGFLTIFWGPTFVEASSILSWLFAWLLFRVMFGAGLIKIRGDSCWRDLTCLHYHYETQPIPNPLSWYFHQFPGLFHKSCVAFTHFVELIIPFGYFLPAPISTVCLLLTIAFQVTLILSGNLSWLNYLTIVIALPCFSDTELRTVLPFTLPSPAPLPLWHQIALVSLAGFVIYRSVEPIRNLLSDHQLMNYSYDPLHLVNTYGAFGSVTKRRFEIVIEGSNSLDGPWKEYEFKGKPTAPFRRPCIMSPYHYRLDWLLWFAAMGTWERYHWFAKLMNKLLIGESTLLALLRHNPFPEHPPRYLRAMRYHYRFTRYGDSSAAWWQRRLVGPYFPTIERREE